MMPAGLTGGDVVRDRLNILALDPANKCGWAFSVGIHGGPPRYGVLNLTGFPMCTRSQVLT
jgi:hypothetical protein